MTRFALLFQLFLLRTSSASSLGSQLPTFSWQKGHDRQAQNSLEIRFPDGDLDLIRFTKTQRFRQDVDNCILTGTLEHEPDVRVTLTGGCNDSQDFEMTIVGSERLRHSTFKVTKGSVEATRFLLNNGFFGLNDAVLAPGISEDIQLPEKSRSYAYTFPKQVWLKVALYADSNFVYNFGDDEKVQSSMLDIVSHAQTWFSEKNLKPEVIIEASFPEDWKYVGSLYPGDDDLKAVAEYVFNVRNSNLTDGEAPTYVRDTVVAFFGISGLFDRIVGIAHGSSVCSKYSGPYVAVIANHWKYVAVTGETLAHELAHTIGIGHDFDSNKYYKRDLSGNSCYTYGSIMDYSGVYTTWSQCSLEAHRGRFQSGQLDCLRMNFDKEAE